jgi:hypothetical protein
MIVKEEERFYATTKKDYGLVERVSEVILQGGFANYKAAEIILMVREHDSK